MVNIEKKERQREAADQGSSGCVKRRGQVSLLYCIIVFVFFL